MSESTPTLSGDSATPLHELKCMEIWGGVEAADAAVQSGGLDVHVLARPWRGDQSGGDIHYLSMCASGHITRFFVADVSGHGAQVAELAVTLRKLLRRHMNTLDTSKLAKAVNAEFAALAQEGRFATALMCTYFAPTHELIAVNAGHPRPLWWRASKKQWSLLTADEGQIHGRGPHNLPLGVIGETGYPQFVVTLEPGDVVMMYTDSLSEAMNAERKMLGEAGLLALAGRCTEQLAGGEDMPGSQRIGRWLLQQVHDYQQGAELEDDLTLVTVSHTGTSPRSVSLGERLAAVAKMVGLRGV